MSTRQQRVLVQQVQESVVTSLFVQTRPQIITGSILSDVDYTCVPDDICSMEPPELLIQSVSACEKLMRNHEKTTLFDEKTQNTSMSLFENQGTTESFQETT